MAEHDSGTIQSRKDFKKTPEGQYRYWNRELKAAEKTLRNFRKHGAKIDEKFKGGKERPENGKKTGFRLNMFHSNAITLQSIMFGNLPKVDVARRFADPNDDVGRVAAEIMRRLLNSDVQDNCDSYKSVFKAVIQDRLLPGLGAARVRYEFDEKTEKESAPVEYFHWRDVCWGFARTYDGVPWIGFRSYLTKDEVAERFGKDVAEEIELKDEPIAGDEAETQESETDSPWQKAEIWEIWDKTNRKVVWYSEGAKKILEEKDDFLELSGFYSNPEFMLANSTTTSYVPTSDYFIAQDLYNEIDTLQTRISIITEAVKVVGVYNQAAEQSLSRVFTEGTDNDLIPVDNWALFAESGGIKGQIDWVPMKEIVETLARLRELRDETIGLLQQITGMSDIMRGDLSGQYEGVGQSQMKVKFGSTRIQSLQEEFAEFVTRLLSIKAEIIGRHFSPQTIASLANVSSMMAPDRELIPQAIALIKQPTKAKLHIQVKPEALAMIDYAQLKNERTEYMTALSGFLASATPLMEKEPGTTPFVLQLLQWGLAGFKGAQQIEGVIDKAIQTTTEALKKGAGKKDDGSAAEQMKMQAEQMKFQNDMQLQQMKFQGELQKIQQKMQADNQTRQVDLQADIAKIKAELEADLQEIAAKAQADIRTEAVTSQINAEQQVAGARAEIVKSQVESEIDINAERRKATIQPKGGPSE